MKLIKPVNSNYAAIIAKVNNTVILDNCDNVHRAIILGNHVIVDKSVNKDDLGVYFPLESALSNEYMYNNNLYNKAELNKDVTQKAYFDKKGRVRAQNFRGHKSEGLFMSLKSLEFTGIDISKLSIGDEFDQLNGIPICSKYQVPRNRPKQSTKQKYSNNKKKYNKIIDTQFRFHDDTNQLYKNLHKINPNSLISITYKMHGTSGVSSYVLCNKELKWYEKLLKKLGVNIVDKHYDYVYSSRRVIKSEHDNPNHFYKEDIWGKAHNILKPFLQKGISFYYEIVGKLDSGEDIQKGYDYGYTGTNFGIYIYRITYTNFDGKVYEFSAKQVQEFCKKNGLNPVQQLFYGYASELSDERMTSENWQNKFLETTKEKYNDKDCKMCVNKVPEEGVVIRIDNNLEFEAYKQKSYRFYEYESSNLDKNVIDIEEENQ